MSSSNLMTLTLKNLGGTQKDLALKLGVSPAQISKWKSGEHMSFDMEEKLCSLAGIGERNPNIVVWTGGTEQADKWSQLIKYLADVAIAGDETGYITDPLCEEDDDLLCLDTLSNLRELGVDIPKEFPAELDFELDDEASVEEFEERYYENPYCKLISDSFRALTDIYGFYAAYFSDIINNDDLELMNTAACNIEPCLLSLAFCNVGKNSTLTPKFDDFKYRTLKEYEEWINIVKNVAFQNSIPLKAELMSMATEDNGSLGHEAEAESMGFNSRRLHPDIYMNEILQSHRIIQQVLPAICKKLDITQEELDFDSLKLYS